MFEHFLLIAGPCTLEDDDLNLRIARRLADVATSAGVPVLFKGSFDKANRARLDAARGPGLVEGLRRLEVVKGETGLRTVTDVHEVAQAAQVAPVVDVIQIPAFLCRQTDLLVAAGETGKAVNIKKGQWMAPEEMAGAVDKVTRAGASAVAVTERGTAHGYGDLVVDMRAFDRLRTATGVPAFFDGTHAVQRSGRDAGASGGDPEHTPALVRAAVAAGCDGLYLETHPAPSTAPSDGATMFPLHELESLMQSVRSIRSALRADKDPQVTP